LGGVAYVGWALFAVSIISGILHYYFSAKCVKLALVKSADIFWVSTNESFVEWALDLTYLLMMLGFLGGAACMLEFMAKYVVPRYAA
jgi:hypothetical protein